MRMRDRLITAKGVPGDDSFGPRRPSPDRSSARWVRRTNGPLVAVLLLVTLVVVSLISSVSADPPDSPSAAIHRDRGPGRSTADQLDPDVGFGVEPMTQTVSVGDTFTVSVYIDAGAERMDAAQAFLDFEPAYVHVQSMTGGGSFDMELLNTYDNTLGQLGYAAATFGSSLSGTVPLVTITFEAMSSTAGTALTFHTTSPRKTKASLIATPLATTVTGGVVVVVSVTPTPTQVPATPTATATVVATATATVVPPASPTTGPYPAPYPGPRTLTPVTGPNVLRLPLIYKNAPVAPPAPTPTATQTPWPPNCSELIANGDFEIDGSWTMPATAYSADYSARQAHGALRSMRMGIDVAGVNKYSYSDARQTVTIPTNATRATLRFWLYAMSGSPAQLSMPRKPLARSVQDAGLASDAQYLLVLSKYGVWTDTLLWQLRDDRTWTYHEVDVTSYAGQTIKLQYGVYNDGYGGVTAMYLDDVSLEMCTGQDPDF